MVRKTAAVAAFAMALGAAGASKAGVTVVGATRAQSCMDAAFAGASSRDAVAGCTTALGEEALSLPDRAGTLVNRGVILMNRRDFDAAIADFDAAARIRPNLGEAPFNRGSARIAQGRYAEGLADIDRSLQLGLREPEKAYYNRALAREELDDSRGAYRDYRKASELKPRWELPRRELARFTVTRQ